MHKLFTEMEPLHRPAVPDAVPSPRRPRTVALITKDNTAGLSVDMELMDHFLTQHGYQVTRIDWRSGSMPTVDIGIFLELYSPSLAKCCRKTIGIFNPEWFMPRWKRYLRDLDQIWCKSEQAVEVFSSHNPNCHLTGFLSLYLKDEEVPRKRSCLHVQGRSMLKNTPAVLEAWRRHPDLPPLTVITVRDISPPENVTVLGRITSEHLKTQINRHWFHICPSRAEGWGHYITEAMSAGAHVVTLDANPMNEHIQPSWGTLIQPTRWISRYDVREYLVDPEDIAHAVRSADAMTDEQLDQQGDLAHDHFLRRNTAFRHTALNLLEKL